MNHVYYRLCVVLLIATSVYSVPLSEDPDQVPSPPPTLPKDDGSADLKPPPAPSSPIYDSQNSGSSTSAEASVYDPNIYGIPAYPDPYPGAYPPQYPPPLGYAPQAGYPTPYVVQTGYEGYIVPATPQVQAVAIPDPFAFLRGLVPNGMVSWLVRSMSVVMGTATVILLGGALTTIVCSLTPICTISFKSLKLLNWNDTAKDVGKMLGEEITAERVRRAASFVQTAIKKYNELQKVFGANNLDVKKQN